jgi:methyl-accepting chemotaxis protein
LTWSFNNNPKEHTVKLNVFQRIFVPSIRFAGDDNLRLHLFLILALVVSGIAVNQFFQAASYVPPYWVFFAAAIYLSAGLTLFTHVQNKTTEAVRLSAERGEWTVSSEVKYSRWWSLAQDLAARMLHLRSVVGQSTQRMFSDSKLISRQTSQLAHNAEEIASMLEETASGMEQFAATIEVGAGNAREAFDQAAEVARVASAGAVNITELIHALRESMDASRHLGEIVAVIEDIAGQTSMLALNAAIEAARAGDSGRGFSTVAAEIRELSQRSSEASRDMRALIAQARADMFESVDYAAKVEADIKSISRQIAKTQTAIGDISNAANEQQIGISQIKLSVEHMASLTQQNVASVEATARGATQLEILAMQLDTSAGAIGGNQFGRKDTVIELAQAARVHILKHGLERAQVDFLDPKGPFWRSNLFVVVTAADGTTVFHAANPNLKGVSAYNLVQPESRAAFKNGVSSAQSAGDAWVEYKILSPITNRESTKMNYFLAIPGTDLLIAVGYYREIEQAVPVTQ